MTRPLLIALLVLLSIATARVQSPYVAYDGDSIRDTRTGERIRISDIDAPEIGSRCRCATECGLAIRARDFLARRLAEAYMVEIVRVGRDRFGRTLAILRVNGRSVGDDLVAAGLARVWTGRREPWCAP